MKWWQFVNDGVLGAGERLKEGTPPEGTLAGELIAAGIRFQELVRSDNEQELVAAASALFPPEEGEDVSWRDLLELVAKARFARAGSLEELKAYQQLSEDLHLGMQGDRAVRASDVHVATRQSPDGRFQGSFSVPLQRGRTRDEEDALYLAEVNRFFSQLDTRELPFDDATFLGFGSDLRLPALALQGGGSLWFSNVRLAEYFWPTASRKKHVFAFTENLANQRALGHDLLQRQVLPGQQLATTLDRWVFGSRDGGVPESAEDLVAFRPEPTRKELDQLAQDILDDPTQWRNVLRWVRVLRLLFGPLPELQDKGVRGLLRRIGELEEHRMRRDGAGARTWEAFVAEVWGDRTTPELPEQRVGFFRAALQETLGLAELPEPRFAVDLFVLVEPKTLRPETKSNVESLLLWARPELKENPGALAAYGGALRALDLRRRSRGGDGVLTKGGLQKLVHGNLRAWGVPDMEFGEGLRLVLEAEAEVESGPGLGLGLGLGGFEVEPEQARGDQVAPALFRSAEPDAG
ncbi:hypothetical protein, partial [Streptomyces sp. NPDC048527]|uniref:hypothetical protein n=1 Tax=Streptomyces sp. NPDC048527 TaxID=3365568 RepID=UPI0037206A08